jgi:hypothetical protein
VRSDKTGRSFSAMIHLAAAPTLAVRLLRSIGNVGLLHKCDRLGIFHLGKSLNRLTALTLRLQC